MQLSTGIHANMSQNLLKMDPCLINQGASNIAPECRKMHLRVMNFKIFPWSMPPDLPYLGGPSAPPIKISIYLLAMFHLPI